MTEWPLRLTGIIALILGGVLFVVAVKYISSEWPQILVGVLSVFLASLGFGLCIMPLESSDSDSSKDNFPPA